MVWLTGSCSVIGWTQWPWNSLRNSPKLILWFWQRLPNTTGTTHPRAVPCQHSCPTNFSASVQSNSVGLVEKLGATSVRGFPKTSTDFHINDQLFLLPLFRFLTEGDFLFCDTQCVLDLTSSYLGSFASALTFEAHHLWTFVELHPYSEQDCSR